MKNFQFKCKGNTESTWRVGIVKAKDEKDARATLDKWFGIERDENNQPVNDLVQYDLCEADEFEKLKNQNGERAIKVDI